MPEVTEVEKRSVSLQWKAPKNDGGSEILGYVIDYRVEGGFKWERSNDEPVVRPKHTVKGLREHAHYEFRVAAVNKGGIGTFAECSMPVEVKEPVGKSPSLCLKTPMQIWSSLFSLDILYNLL